MGLAFVLAKNCLFLISRGTVYDVPNSSTSTVFINWVSNILYEKKNNEKKERIASTLWATM